MPHYFFLSPHPDDAVWSCGNLMDHLVRSGDRVAIVTMFSSYAGCLTSFGKRWIERCGLDAETIEGVRRDEDERAATFLGVDRIDAGLPDAAVRPWYEGANELAGERAELDRRDQAPEEALHFLIEQVEQARSEPVIVSGAGFGGHVDHQAVALAASKLQTMLGLQLWWYEDFPYVAKEPAVVPVQQLAGCRSVHVPIGTGRHQTHRTAASIYASQVKGVWGNEADFARAFDNWFAPRRSGSRLWVRSDESRASPLVPGLLGPDGHMPEL